MTARLNLCAAAALVATTLPGQAPTEKRLAIGAQDRVVFSADLKRLAVGDERVISAELLDTREALVIAKQRGITTLIAWFDGGRVETTRFTVAPDVAPLQRALADLAPSVTVEAAADRDAVILRGVVPDYRVREAVLRAADAYLLAGSAPTIGVAPKPDQPAPVVVNVGTDPEATSASGQVIDLLRVEALPSTLEGRMQSAIRALTGETVEVHRVTKGAFPDDTKDVMVLTGTVPDQITLTRVVHLAAQVLGDDEDVEIEVIADEAGGVFGANGQNGGLNGGGGLGGGGGGLGGGGLGGGGVGGGGRGGGGTFAPRGNVQRNIGRATALRAAGGRLLSFLSVDDLPSVRVSIRIYEVDRNRLLQFGAETKLLGGDVQQPRLLPSPIGDLLQDDPAQIGGTRGEDLQAGFASVADGLTQQVQLAGSQIVFDALFRLLEARGIARSLSSPNLTVLSGERAQFQVGGDVPIPQAFTPAAGNTSGLGTFASVAFRRFGVGLGITPLVGKAGQVTLSMSTNVSQPDQQLTTLIRSSTGVAPQTTAFSSRFLMTNAKLGDGQALLIGGLVQQSDQGDVSKTPFLGDLPLIGWLFRSTNDSFDSSELFIVISPTVVRDPIAGADLWALPSASDTLSACRRMLRPTRRSTPSEQPSGQQESQQPQR